MDDIRETRSAGLAMAVVATMGLGVILGYALTWVSTRADQFGDGADKIKLGQVGLVLDLYGRGWILELARVGVLLAVIAALAFPRSQRELQAVCITAGALAALALPHYVLTELEALDSPGAGLILLAIAAGITAIIPWVAEYRSAEYRSATTVTMEPVRPNPQR